jgi:hypothetical protein
MKRLKTIVLFEFLVLVAMLMLLPGVGVNGAGPNIFYVGPNGNDNNNGLTPGTAWASLIKADAAWTAGTSGTCTASSGWYSETGAACIHILDGSTGWYANAQDHHYNRGGTSEATRVVYLADNQYGPHWTFTSNTPVDIFPDLGSYITFAGLDVTSGTGSGNQDGTNGSGYNKQMYIFESHSPHDHFMGNRVHDVALGQCTGHGGAGFADLDDPGVFDTWIIGNEVMRVGPLPYPNEGDCRFVRGIYAAGQVLVINNYVHNNSGDGIAVTHQQVSTGSLIAYNTVTNNGGYGWGNNGAGSDQQCCIPNCAGCTLQAIGDGITVAADLNKQNVSPTVTNNIVYNNAAQNMKNSGSALPGCGIVLACQNGFVVNGLISHNLIGNPQQAGTRAGGTACGTTFADVVNACSGNTGNTISSNVHLSSSPFVNYLQNGSGDMRPAVGSPAIGEATNSVAAGGSYSAANLPTKDIKGTTRTTASAGAFEPAGSALVANMQVLPAAPVVADVTVASCGADVVETLSNTGSASLTVSSFGVLPNELDFRKGATGNCAIGQLLGPAQFCTMSVKLCPATPGPKVANFNVVTTAPNSPIAIPLSGNAIAVPAPSGLTVTVQ